jgi:hypothetical protein
MNLPISHYVNGVLCKMLLRVAVYCYFFFVCSTWRMQFTSKCQISNFLMKKFKYVDLPQYLFINMISYCCKQKFLYRFFIINMTRNISKLYKEEINENIRLRKLPSVLLLLVNYSVVYCYFLFKF